jgi:hypothetical protein
MTICLLTDIAISLCAAAVGDASAVAVTHVALGDGLGANYDPVKSQVSLRRELARRPIDSRYQLAEKSWHVKCDFPANTPNFIIREIGFFTTANQLIGIAAGLNFEPRQAGVTSYLCDYVLNFDDVANGLIIIAAPDDEVFYFSLATLRVQAIQQVQILKLQEHFE